ncbi:hypothetical protein ACJMK2_019908 [Sinanodonta woodiana]|uniref:Nuclear pore complex protein Nup160 n=1 Tax=Sinanodonta woodiana TaxID=1069815 RepID=A0ABD3U046_SINWO
MAENVRMGKYREVSLATPVGLRWKEITLNTGASASTLQDIKVPESCGGYAYKDTSLDPSPLRNRFICWKAYGDVLELVEQSLDQELSGSHLKYRFQDTPILGGISVHEVHGNVIILVATVASVHRLVFPHPSRLRGSELGFGPYDTPLPSVFFDASLPTTTESRNMYMLHPGGSITSQFHTAATYLMTDGEAVFALANSDGSIVIIVMPPLGIQGIVQHFQLNQSGMMQKIWSGLVPSYMRGGGESPEATSSMVLYPVRGDLYVFAICRDCRLRVWSVKSKDCTLVCSMLNYLPDGSQLQATGGYHTIKLQSGTDQFDTKFVVHLSFQERNEFCVLQPIMKGGRLQIHHISSVSGPSEDLIDFCFTSTHLVTLWTSSAGHAIVRTSSIGDAGDPCRFQDVILEPPKTAELHITPNKDPREIYLNTMFQPGHISFQDVRKALNLQVYSQYIDPFLLNDANLSASTLRQQVTVAVETEIHNLAFDYELEEEDYYQLQLDQWTKFYSCCIQYHEVSFKLKGVFSDSSTGMIALIRKGCLTFLRPCDAIEQLYFGDIRNVDPGSILDQQIEDLNVNRDLSQIWSIIQMISLEVSDDMAQQLEQEAFSNDTLNPLCEQIIDSIILNTEFADNPILQSMDLVHSFPQAIDVVLRELDLTPDDELDMDQGSDPLDMAYNCLFTSATGTGVVSCSVRQFAETRCHALRDLILLQMLVLRLKERNMQLRKLEVDLLPMSINLFRAYLIVKWAAQAVAVPTQSSIMELNLRHLSSLELSENSAKEMSKIDSSNTSMLELLIRGQDGERVRAQLANNTQLDDDPKQVWSIGLNALNQLISRLLWPLSESFTFGQFLIGCCQYLPLQEYLCYLNLWCDWIPASRSFALGLCYLHFDEPHKAADCFNEARGGVTMEPFLRDNLLQTQQEDDDKLQVIYYLKVIKQFEEFSAPDVVISLAKKAIETAGDDENVPTLWSKVFKYELELGHNNEAYQAMMSNPDPTRRKDCLRQLLVRLCEKGDLQSLVDFEYTNLQDEVESILESRARSVDLTTHNYYDLLYAYYIFRDNFRKAGRVMYEHGWRLGREVPGQQGLQRQAQCYLAALNALRLAQPEYAWIIKPPQVVQQPLSAKHALTGEEVKDQRGSRKPEILEMQDIEKEYLLVDARLRLIQKDPDPALASGPTPGPDELVGLLAKAGLYDRAVIVCRAFKFDLYTVFESLALRCVNLSSQSTYQMRGDNDYTAQAWSWLKENHLTLTNIAKENSSVDQAWQLLQQYLDRYEDHQSGSAKYHRCVANKLLSHGFSLPTWFVNTYKSLNVAELLRLYIDYDLMYEGVDLVMEYIDAVMDTFKGQDCAMFKLRGCLRHMPQSVWLPYTSIDQLLQALRDHRMQDMALGELFETLQSKLSVYQRQIQTFSEQVLHQY